MNTKTAYAREFFKHRRRLGKRLNLYPLLGVALVILAALLGYGAMYLLLTS